MAGRLQLRRGTTLQNEAFTGAVGEPTLDTETGLIHIHDGQTQGGKEFIDAVVAFQKPTAENGYTWYRLYASGWVEQGGWKNSTSETITFPVAMALTNQYTAIAVHNGSASKGEGVIHCYNKTSTTMSVGLSISGSGMAGFSWQVSGMAAQGA